MCELSLTNKNELQSTLHDSNPEGDKVIIMVHKNNLAREFL